MSLTKAEERQAIPLIDAHLQKERERISEWIRSAQSNAAECGPIVTIINPDVIRNIAKRLRVTPAVIEKLMRSRAIECGLLPAGAIVPKILPRPQPKPITREPTQAKTGLTPARVALKALAEKHPELAITPTRNKFETAVEKIGEAAPDVADRAFMARQMVLCTLPHSDPGDVPQWSRTAANASLTLGITPGRDVKHNRSWGYPYGTIPRLLLFWIMKEIELKKNCDLTPEQKCTLHLGKNLAVFMRAVGLNPDNGGPRSDAKRLHEQAQRLFHAHISFIYTTDANRDRWINMPVGEGGEDGIEIWWTPKSPNQDTLWNSTVEIGHRFYAAVVASLVPIDMRALQALRRSPLELDLYAWASYTAYAIVKNKRKPKPVRWKWLQEQIGGNYGETDDFRKKAKAALKKIQRLYPGLNIVFVNRGFEIHATRLALPEKQIGRADPVKKLTKTTR